jgi:adenosylcobinamide kinase / adenosylcobinamide-phosphate guanylyltransferase
VIFLVLGGARSGKSAVGERLATELAGGDPVTVLATAVVGDDDMAARVAAHRARRPEHWVTVEAGCDLLGALHSASGTVLVDALGTWVAAAPGLAVDPAALSNALVARTGPTVVVSDEVGLGVHPTTEPGRRFRDVLGELNSAVARVAGEVLLVVAGRALRLDEPLAVSVVGTVGRRAESSG